MKISHKKCEKTIIYGFCLYIARQRHSIIFSTNRIYYVYLWQGLVHGTILQKRTKIMFQKRQYYDFSET